MGWILLIGGIVGIGLGVVIIFAAGMSDSPSAGDSAARTGCIAGSAGLISLVVGAVILINRLV